VTDEIARRVEKQATAFGKVEIDTSLVQGDRGWNIKPWALLRCLEDWDEVVWYDSDMLTLGDWLTPIQAIPSEVMVVTEEFFWGQRQGGIDRTVAWGLTPRRNLHSTINSCLMRVSAHHSELLSRWRSMLESESYLRAQLAPYKERPLHYLGDQEVLTALVGSVSEGDLEVHMLRRGKDIAQCFGPSGYTVQERVRNLLAHKTPPLIHAMGRKPWEERSGLPYTRGWWDALHAELSPYTLGVLGLEGSCGENTWEDATHLSTKLLRLLTGNNPNLAELPLALIDSIVRRYRRRLGIGRYV
jgi:hypothetical protein